MEKIRVLSLGLFSHQGKILAARGHDKVTNEVFYRPFGGGVEFGERSGEALAREIKEELGEVIQDLRLLGTLENIYVFDGKPGHEIVFVYDARFAKPEVYSRSVLQGVDERKKLQLEGAWLRLEDIQAKLVTIYPSGIEKFFQLLICRN